MAPPATIRKFNPGMFQSDAKVKKGFVVRQRTFEGVMKVVERNVDVSSCQHVLLVGARGQGKTMLLARVKAELCSRRNLARRLLPVWFMEESYEIWSAADFWLEAMAYVADAIDTSRAGEVRAERRRLAESNAAPRTIAKAARDAALAAADGRKLVLMVENLQSLCEAVARRGRMRRGGIGWLRETLAPCSEQVMLLATATSLFEGLGRRQTFFKAIDLPPLDTSECETLLKSLDQKRTDARELEILTGGNPRLLAIVGSFAHEARPSRLADDLVSLIDEHTDYFKNYLENLALGERRVFVALADLWRPATTKEVAARARMDLRSVSALLGKLSDSGVVGKEKGQDGKFRYFATMRLVGIYHKLRRGRDKDVVVPNLFRFLTAAYHTDDAARLYDGGLSDAGLSDAARREVSAIIAGALNEAASKKDAKGMLADSEDMLRRFGGDDHGPEVQLELAKACTRKGYAHAELGDHQDALKTWSDLTSKYSGSDDPEIRSQVAWALLGMANAHRVGGDRKRAADGYDSVVRLLEETTEPALRLIAGRALLLKGAHELDSDAKDAAKDSFERACRILDVQSDLGERLAWYAIVCLTALQPNVKADYVQQVYAPVVEKLRQDSPTTAAVVTETASPPGRASWYARWLRANLLLALGEHSAALETFRQAYALYDPTETKTISELLAFSEQIAGSGSADMRERLREVLESDKERAEQIRPLVRALDDGDGADHALDAAEAIAIADDLAKRLKRGDRAPWLAAAADMPKVVGDLVLKAREEAERWWEHRRSAG